MVEYSERLKAAMARAQVKTRTLSDAIGMSYQGVKKVIDGKSNAFSAENNSRAAAVLGVNPDWLATGEGAMAGDEVASTPSEPTLPEALELVANALSSVPAEKRQALLGVLTTYASDPTNESDSLKYLQSELQKAQKQPQHIDPATIPTGHPPGGKT